MHPYHPTTRPGAFFYPPTILIFRYALLHPETLRYFAALFSGLIQMLRNTKGGRDTESYFVCWEVLFRVLFFTEGLSPIILQKTVPFHVFLSQQDV